MESMDRLKLGSHEKPKTQNQNRKPIGFDRNKKQILSFGSVHTWNIWFRAKPKKTLQNSGDYYLHSAILCVQQSFRGTFFISIKFLILYKVGDVLFIVVERDTKIAGAYFYSLHWK